MLTWTNKDKSNWIDGEWKNEPDKAQWIDEATGLDCLIVRNPGGALCGYVGVPESHPNFGKEYDSVEADVHGGLTFSDKCHPSQDPAKDICHVHERAANAVVWWLGFDCAHYGDFSPAYERSRVAGESYKNFAYVKAEVSALAKQLHEKVTTTDARG